MKPDLTYIEDIKVMKEPFTPPITRKDRRVKSRKQRIKKSIAIIR